MRPEGQSRRDEVEAEIRVGWRMAALGMEVAAQVAAGAILGWLFDRWRGTEPTGLLVGSVAGIVVGLCSLVMGALKLNRQLEKSHPTAGRGRPIPPPPEPNDASPADDRWDLPRDGDDDDHDPDNQ